MGSLFATRRAINVWPWRVGVNKNDSSPVIFSWRLCLVGMESSFILCACGVARDCERCCLDLADFGFGFWLVVQLAQLHNGSACGDSTQGPYLGRHRFFGRGCELFLLLGRGKLRVRSAVVFSFGEHFCHWGSAVMSCVRGHGVVGRISPPQNVR